MKGNIFECFNHKQAGVLLYPNLAFFHKDADGMQQLYGMGGVGWQAVASLYHAETTTIHCYFKVKEFFLHCSFPFQYLFRFLVQIIISLLKLKLDANCGPKNSFGIFQFHSKTLAFSLY